jgi:DNA-binding PadR family transcriptional regulator
MARDQQTSRGDLRGRAVGGRDRHALPLMPVEFLVLAVLVDRPTHGYGLVRGIEERTGGAISPRPGDLYRVLSRMAERGWIERLGQSPAADRDDPSGDARRTEYSITDSGREVVRAEAELMAAVSGAVLGSDATEEPA